MLPAPLSPERNMEENAELETGSPFHPVYWYNMRRCQPTIEPLDFWTKEVKAKFNRTADKHGCHRQGWLSRPSVEQTARGRGPGGQLPETQA